MIGFRICIFLKGHGMIVDGPVLESAVIKGPGNPDGPDGIQAVCILNHLKIMAVSAIQGKDNRCGRHIDEFHGCVLPGLGAPDVVGGNDGRWHCVYRERLD